MFSHSHLQVQLYEDFAKSRAKASVEDSISMSSNEEEEKPKLKATGHVFQVQLYLLALPCLIFQIGSCATFQSYDPITAVLSSVRG